jgi:hypothetical protein
MFSFAAGEPPPKRWRSYAIRQEEEIAPAAKLDARLFSTSNTRERRRALEKAMRERLTPEKHAHAAEVKVAAWETKCDPQPPPHSMMWSFVFSVTRHELYRPANH